MKPDIVCVGLVSWPGNYTKSTIELMNELSRTHRVLFVNYAYTLNDVFKHLRKRTNMPLRAVLGLADRITDHKPASGGVLQVLTPPWLLPINALPPGRLHTALLNWNARRMARCIRRATRRLHFDSPVVINCFHPLLGVAMQGQLNERALLYYCYDDIRAEPWSRQHGEPYEKQFLCRVDAVVTTSMALAEAKRPFQPNTYVVENGVDFGQYQATAEPEKSPSDVLTVGYVGAMDNRIDWPLLERCFAALPHVRFLLVGRPPAPAVVTYLQQFPNVEFSGLKPPADIPAWVRQMDVGLIPFVKNEQTRAIYPMKLNEYLATGMPVVTTDFTELGQFDGLIHVATDADAFVDALRRSLLEGDASIRQQRVAMARSNSWENRGMQLSAIIDDVLARQTTAKSSVLATDAVF